MPEAKGRHGGKRPGAGRKRQMEDGRPLVVRVPGALYDRVSEAAAGLDVPLAAYVRAVLGLAVDETSLAKELLEECVVSVFREGQSGLLGKIGLSRTTVDALSKSARPLGALPQAASDADPAVVSLDVILSVSLMDPDDRRALVETLQDMLAEDAERTAEGGQPEGDDVDAAVEEHHRREARRHLLLAELPNFGISEVSSQIEQVVESVLEGTLDAHPAHSRSAFALALKEALDDPPFRLLMFLESESSGPASSIEADVLAYFKGDAPLISERTLAMLARRRRGRVAEKEASEPPPAVQQEDNEGESDAIARSESNDEGHPT